MTWETGGTILALYIALVASTLCLYPGLIRRQAPERLRRLLWQVTLGHVLIFYGLFLCDMTLLYIFPGHPIWDHARRVGARWAWAVLYLWFLTALWQTLPAQRKVWGRGACAIGLLLALTLTPIPATTQEPASVYGNMRSRIYHWLGCPNYPRLPDPGRWQAFKTTQDAEQAGYRAARNCRQK